MVTHLSFHQLSRFSLLPVLAKVGLLRDTFQALLEVSNSETNVRTINLPFPLDKYVGVGRHDIHFFKTGKKDWRGQEQNMFVTRDSKTIRHQSVCHAHSTEVAG